jgi:hypothetical protein
MKNYIARYVLVVEALMLLIVIIHDFPFWRMLTMDMYVFG